MKILYGIIGLIVVLGGAWYVASMPKTPTQTETPDANTENMNSDVPSTETAQFKGSMQGLLARGGSWQCDVSSTVDGIISTGTTYVAGGMMRADFTSNIPQVGEMETHMIMRENTAYTWTSMMNMGLKFPISEAEGEAEVSAEVAAQVNQEYDYSCKAWPTDESKFALPEGIAF